MIVYILYLKHSMKSAFFITNYFLFKYIYENKSK